jgi:phosphoribosyl 1,2-cyclic phosphodiesterase
LRYGGNTTCVEVRLGDGTLIIIDAGSGMRLLGKELLREKDGRRICLLLTHSHWDHIMGFPFFVPAYYGRYTIHVWGGSTARRSLKNYLERQMEPPYFPVEFDVMRAKFVFESESPGHTPSAVGEVMTAPLSHPNGGSGYKFVEDGKSFVFLTDNELAHQHEGGLTRDGYVEICRDADLLLHDAQYTDEEYERTKGWGHSTYNQVTSLAVEAGVKRLGLFHHDPDRIDDDLDAYVAGCQARVCEANAGIECFAAAEGTLIDV